MARDTQTAAMVGDGMLALSKFKNRKDLSEVEVAAVGNGNPIENNFRPAVAISNRAEYFKLVGVPQACFASRATQFRNSAAQRRHQVTLPSHLSWTKHSSLHEPSPMKGSFRLSMSHGTHTNDGNYHEMFRTASSNPRSSSAGRDTVVQGSTHSTSIFRRKLSSTFLLASSHFTSSVHVIKNQINSMRGHINGFARRNTNNRGASCILRDVDKRGVLPASQSEMQGRQKKNAIREKQDAGKMQADLMALFEECRRAGSVVSTDCHSEEYYVQNLHCGHFARSKTSLKNKIARKFDLLHARQADAQLNELNTDTIGSAEVDRAHI